MNMPFLGGGGGGGVLNTKMLEAKYEAKLEFPGGKGGGGINNLLWNCTVYKPSWPDILHMVLFQLQAQWL